MTEATIKTIQLLVFDPDENKEEGTPSVRMGVRPDGEDKDALQWLTAHTKMNDKWVLAIGWNPFKVINEGEHNGCNAFSLIGKRVMIETEKMKNYVKVIDVQAIAEEAKPEPTADDTDFSDLPTEPKKEIEADELPF